MKSLTLTLIAVISASASAQASFNTPSGLLLGIYASPAYGGMRVSSTIPGYSAQGVLFSGDVLLRTTVDGFQIYQLRSQWEMEQAKLAIGSNQQAAVEIWRPGTGLMYAWVEFTPIGGPVVLYSKSAQPQKYQAHFKLDNNAKGMFQKQPGGGLPFNKLPGNGNFGHGGQNAVPLPVPSNNSASAANLFNR